MKQLTHNSLTGRARRRTRTLNVLVACEESQAECIAFRRLGHRAFSCDLQFITFAPMIEYILYTLLLVLGVLLERMTRNLKH